MVHPQVLQTLLQQAANVRLSGNTCLDLFVGAGEKLGGHHHLVPLGKVPQGPAQVLLAGAVLITDGSIEEVDAKFQPLLDDLPGVFLVNCPAVLAVGGVAKAHAPHADSGHSQIRIAQLCVFHR